MYRLFYYPNNASLAPHLVLRELGVEYELVLVDTALDAHKSLKYLQLNPAGRIPTLVDGSLVLFESPAICMHLCETHPEKGLMPGPGSPLRPLFYQWLSYLNNTLQAELMVYYYPERHCSDKQSIASVVAAQEKRIAESLSILNAQLEGRPFLLGDKLSACDFFFFMLAEWSLDIEQSPLDFEYLRRYLQILAQHPTVLGVCQAENIDLGPFL